MDLPKKRSSKYVAGIYAFFIILFAFTLSLFYASKCQKSPSPAKQDAGILKPQDSFDNYQKNTKIFDANKGQSDDKHEVSKSENKIKDDKISAPLPQKKSQDNQKTSSDGFKAPSGEPVNPCSQKSLSTCFALSCMLFSQSTKPELSSRMPK